MENTTDVITTEKNINDSNDFQEDNDVYIPPGLNIVSGFGILILIVLAVMGNLLVIMSFIKDKQLQTVYNMYIIGLAICDFFIGSISMPFYAYFTLNEWVWVFGYTFCVAWSVNDYSFCLEIIFLTILISLDRTLLVTNGVRYITKETKWVAGTKITISFVVAFGTYGSVIIGWKYWRGYSIIEDMNCDVEFNDSFYFNLAIATFELILPVSALSVLNFIIFWKIRKRMKEQDVSKLARDEILNAETRDTASRDAPFVVDADVNVRRHDAPATNRQPEVQRTVRQDKRAAKCLAVLVAAFLLMWGPYTIIQVIKNVCDHCVNKHLDEFFVWFLWAKSSINPFLYALQNDRFKANIFKFLPCLKLLFKRNNRVANS